jgi:NAD(P)-dependent dehydrogenase (short-subunit alcohol dehydrogenase family)
LRQALCRSRLALPTDGRCVVAGRVDGKVCIVTGAGSGIGRASAIRLAEEGARVTCVDLREDAVRMTTEEIGDAAFPVAADISDDAQVRAYTDGTVSAGGGSMSSSTTRA